ncbi:hypothetical protein ACIOJ9_39975 [Streptomyces sp. NPDC088175]|uniref:hypothetical protein n=1 Tax=unclassified Streptomyces TaxID=2593676 RepID=UPI003822A951
MTFYDHTLTARRLAIRYAVGGQQHCATVLASGHSLEEHVDRLEALGKSSGLTGGLTYVSWPLAEGGAVAIRLDSIVALEAIA